jgi:hypothetical protein
MLYILWLACIVATLFVAGSEVVQSVMFVDGGMEIDGSNQTKQKQSVLTVTHNLTLSAITSAYLATTTL